MFREFSSLTVFIALLVGGFFVYPRPVDAAVDIDRRYSLSAVGILRASDNVDGLFADYVAAAYKVYFARQSRFSVQDLGKADALLTSSKLPYSQLIRDADVLSQVARAVRAESLFRTTIQKQGRQYRFLIEWLHAPRLDLLASEEFILEEPRSGEGIGNIQAPLDLAMDRLLSKVPFLGQVTGRDNLSVTLDIGKISGLRRGDVLTIATLEQVKTHPLLKTVVHWELAPVGKVEIEEVDERISFGKVIEEEPNFRVARWQKVSRITPAPEPEPVEIKGTEAEPLFSEPPRLGWISGGLLMGHFGRQFSQLGGGASGAGVMFGPQAEGQLWFTRDWFGELALSHSSWGYAQKDLVTGEKTAGGSVSASASTFRIAGGYAHPVTGDFFGPKGWLKLGLQSVSFTFPASVSEFTGPMSFTGLFLGLGGDLPIRSKYRALLDIQFGLFPSASQMEGVSGSVNSASQVRLYLGGTYEYAPRISFRAGFDILSQGADFSGGQSISHTAVNFAPGLMYFF